MAMDDVILTVFKIMDCPLLPWDVWKTTLADCKRCHPYRMTRHPMWYVTLARELIDI